MDKRRGVEGTVGLGNGRVSEASRRALEKAEDLCRRRRPNEAVPYLEEALKDRNNLDAIIQTAFIAPTTNEGVEYLEDGERIGRGLIKKWLGKDCFDDGNPNVGNFFAIVETRPYMRVLQALVRFYMEVDRPKESCKTILEMIRLNRRDPMGQRTWLGSMLNQSGRHSDALYFAQQWLKDDPPPDGGITFTNPDPNVPKDMEHVEFVFCQYLYTAALSSFKVYGDCKQSRKYLEMARKSNPIVLTKILARIKRPSSLNMLPRQLNGPEDAQDYLWMTQSVWMQDDVWNWANGSESRDGVLKKCGRKECYNQETKPAEYKRCAACHTISYCGQPCQKQDWKTHKPDCQQHKEIKAATKAFEKGKVPPAGNTIPVMSASFDTIALPSRSGAGN